MDSRSLSYARAFVALGRERHFGRAAASLEISQSALSRQITELESRLGFSLVQRTTRQTRLTPAGQRLWQGMFDGLAQIDEALGQAREFARGSQGIVRIGYTRVSMICRGGVAIKAVRQEFPDIVIEMHELGTNAQIEALKGDRIDIGLLHPPVDDPTITLVPLGDEPIVVVAAPSNPLSARQHVMVSDLCGEPTILYPREVGPHLYDQIVSVCTEAGFEPNVIQRCTSWETAVDLAADGLGVAWCPKVFADRGSDRVSVLKVDEPLPFLPCAVATGRGRRDASVRTLVERIKVNAAPDT